MSQVDFQRFLTPLYFPVIFENVSFEIMSGSLDSKILIETQRMLGDQ